MKLRGALVLLGYASILVLFLFLAILVWHGWIGVLVGAAGGLLVAWFAARRERSRNHAKPT